MDKSEIHDLQHLHWDNSGDRTEIQLAGELMGVLRGQASGCDVRTYEGPSCMKLNSTCLYIAIHAALNLRVITSAPGT